MAEIPEPKTRLEQYWAGILDKIEGGGGGNPNYVETIEGTLENPWGGIDIEALGHEINDHDDATIIMDISVPDMGTSRLGYFVYEASPISIGGLGGGAVSSAGFSVVLAGQFWWDENGLLTTGVMYQGDKTGGTFTDLLPMAQQITTVTTIYHHPMPNSGT